MELTTQSTDALVTFRDGLRSHYEKICADNLTLDLTRGKPSTAQLDLSNALDGILAGFYLLQDGTDVRNYGGILGIPEAREFGASLLGVSAQNTLAGGNSSLSLMYAYIDMAMNHGASGTGSAWADEAGTDNRIKFLCPVPGYDRHFTICEQFDIEMVPVDMTDEGPDMDQVESLVEADPLIKGIWCVPKYSNPTGTTYSDSVVKRFAALPNIAGANFRVMWDNAYAVHHFTDDHDSLLDLMPEAQQLGNGNNMVLLASTSKITFAGAGVAFLGSGEDSLACFEKYLSASVIGFDKVNQLRHVRFLKDKEGLSNHMEKHRTLLEPRFELVQSILEDELKALDIANWTTPSGGYFVSLDTQPGLATEVIRLAASAGVKLTPAGATFPYGHDPSDSNIRIAPTFPKLDELKQAMEVFIVCLKLATVEQLIATRG